MSLKICGFKHTHTWLSARQDLTEFYGCQNFNTHNRLIQVFKVLMSLHSGYAS